MAKDNFDDIVGGVNLGGLTDFLFVFTDGSQDANWQGATKGFIGDVAVDGLQANERTSGGVPFSGMLYTNDVSADAWQDIVGQNPGTASVSTGETDLIGSLEADLSSAFDQIDALTVTSGYESVDASDLNGLNTQNGIAETYVINVTSGFSVAYTIDITGDADDIYILRWDENADPTDGYQGTVKFQSGGGINPLGDLSPSNFINVAGDINASGGGSTPSGLVDDVSSLDGVGGGGFFTGYWLTTGDPVSEDTQSLSNAIFVGGWYTSSDKFSLTSGTSGVYVAPTATSDPVDPPEEPDDCINILENTSPVIADLDCGDGANPDVGVDICAVTHKDMNGFGEDTDKPTSYTLTLGDELTDEINSTQGDKLEVGAVMPGDDGDGSYYVVVTRESDSTKASNQFFAGTVGAGESFTASEAAFGTSFGSETFVHIFSSAGGTLLQTINFHTSCSAPLVIGDQYGSVSLEGAALVGKDTGTIYEVGGTSAPGDEGVTYEIKDGPGADLFTVNADGEVSFKEAPDFEDPQGLLDADGKPTNNYEVTVICTKDDGTVEEKIFEVCVEDDCINILENTSPVIADLDCGDGANPDVGVDICAVTHKDMNGFGEDTDKPTSYTLTLGDELTDEINSTQGDKLEVGAVMPGDDGDGSYYVVVTRESDSTKASNQFFAGTVGAGESFTASEAAFGTSFGSETFVHIFSSAGGTLLQTINFHTSCSAPLVIGDQYGSVSLEGAALVGKDTGTVYEVGGTSAPGDEGVTYEIKDGPGSDLFTVNADGEVSFKEAPDFEDPQGLLDADGKPTNNYEVTVICTKDDGTVEEKIFEVCVEDQDCIKILENTDPGIIADLDCEDQEPENPDQGLDLCAERDALRDSGIDASKLTQLTLNLGETLTTESSTDQGGKLEVGSVQPGDDSDGIYFIRVSNKDNPNDTKENYFTGVVNAGDSFSFSSAPIRNEFGAETRVHIFDQDGTFLQTINFHTSCSAPIAIGDQYGSITLQAGAFTDKDTGALIEYGGATQREVVYEITGGDGFDPEAGTSPFFNVDPQTGEVTLAFNPDFENPLDDNGDNNYVVEVTGYFVNADGSREVCEVKPIEICIEDDIEPGSLSGRYFCDTNDNDVDDGRTTDPGVAGVLVTLIDENGNPVLVGGSPVTTVTDGEGNYSFTGLEPGIYGVKFTDPTGVLDGKQLVASNVGGDDRVDSDANGDTAESVIEGIVVKQGEDTPDNDAGAEYTASLGDKVFFDEDRDGIQDDGEAGVAGVTVTLTGGGDDGVIGSLDDTTTVAVTDANGEYLFDGLDPGTEYKVTFSDLPAGTEFTTPDQGGNDAADSDADPTNGMTDIVTLAPGEENLTLDAGIVSKLGSLSGRYFCDDDRDGLDNDGVDSTGTPDGSPSSGIEGVTVTLLDASGNPTSRTTTTDSNGNYAFTGLVAGTYGVLFADSVSGKQLTAQDVGDDDGIDSDASDLGGGQSEIIGITVVAGMDTPDNDAGVFPNEDPEPADDAAALCATEEVTIDVLANDTDPFDPLSVTHINGVEVMAGDEVTLGSGAIVTLNADGTISYDSVGGTYDGVAAADMVIGTSAIDSFTYSVSDGLGGEGVATVNIGICGALNTVETIAASGNIPASVSFRIDTLAETPLGDAYTLTTSNPDNGNALFEGAVFTEAYCLDGDDALVRGVEIDVDVFVGTAALAAGSSLSATALDNLDLITWILNQDFGSKDNGDGVGDTYTDTEIQGAIWKLVGDTPFVPGGTGTVDNALEIVEFAFNDIDCDGVADGGAEGFEAGAGDILALILDPEIPSKTGHVQPFVIGVDFDDVSEECVCNVDDFVFV